jgi:glycosyltransferase involved in cell wall biosynthesis
LFESENVEDLAEKLEILMGNEELRKQFGKAGQERAEREFSRDVYFKKLCKFYGEIIEKR